MKKLLTIMLCLTLLCGTLCLSGCADKVFTSGDYEYTLSGGNAVRIIRYTGSEEALQLPAELDGKSVTAIGEGAFQGNLSIQTLTVPEGITDIGDYAFECCASLTSLTLPASLRTLGKGAFSGCVMLETADIAEGLESLGDGAFFFCRRLQQIALPGTVKTVGAYLFAECGALTAAELGEGMTAVGERMFWKCISLRSAQLPESITEIGTLAFSGCEMLSEFAVPAGVTEIGAYAFDGCGSLNSLTFPAKTVHEYTFRGCYSMEQLHLTDKVTAVEAHAFTGATCMEDFVIPASVTEIAPGAFDSMNTPAYKVEEGNPNYRDENGVLLTADGTKLLAYPTGLTEPTYEIPACVTTIAPYAFAGVYQLTSLTLPATVTTLEDYALFELCNLPEFTLPATVKSIGSHVFESMSAQTLKVEMPLTELPEGTFMNSNSEKIILPETLETIGKDAFCCAGSMTELTLPKNLKTVADGALAGTDCRFTSESAAFKVENNALYTADGKTLVYYKNPFENTEFTIPEGVETVAPYALDSRFLTQIRVPASLETVGEYGLGYQFISNSHGMEANAVPGLQLIGAASDTLRSYAAENHIGCFTAEPVQNLTEVTLAGDETASFTVENANPEDVSYSSFDSDIVSVTQDGTITAHRQGKAEVFASVGFTVFKCTVTVTSDGKPNPKAFDAGKYRDLSKDEVPTWLENYFKANEGRISLDPERNPYSAAYKGENYFEGIWAAQVDESEYDAGAIDLFGKDFRPQLGMMGHGLEVELGRYTQTDDLVLYSGTTDFSRFIGKQATVKNLKESIGTTITEPFFFSTALQESVAPTFAGPYCSVFIIYADKELIDGGYIEGTVGQGAGGEYEILLTGGVKMEILDAGIREISVEDQWTGEVSTMNETYMKVRLLPKD